VVALAFVAWSYYSRESQNTSSGSPAPATTAPDNSQASPAERATASPSNASTAPAVIQPVQPIVSSPVPGAPSQASAVAPTQTPLPRSTGLTLIIKARQDSWISISIDGEVSTQSTLSASTQRTVHASEEIVVRAGNVGALDFVFNGKKLASQGEFSEVKTLTFTARGLQAPAPKSEVPAP
jgi:cytoskeletal protein RodZ